MTLARLLDTIKPGLPPWGPHVRFRRVQTLVREGSPLVRLRILLSDPTTEYVPTSLFWSSNCHYLCVFQCKHPARMA
jgi:hypothetical protein